MDDVALQPPNVSHCFLMPNALSTKSAKLVTLRIRFQFDQDQTKAGQRRPNITSLNSTLGSPVISSIP